MVDQSLHGGFHFATGWRGQLSTRHDRALPVRFAKLYNGLTDDRHGLTHFFHAAQVAVIAIAILADRNLEFEFVITFIGLCAAQIPSEAGATRHDARETPIKDVLFIDDADIDVALFEDAVFRQQAVHIDHEFGHELVCPRLNIFNKASGQVLVHTTGAEISRVQARAARTFAKHHQLFAFLKAPDGRGQRADVHRLRGDVHQVVQHTADFTKQHADQRCATWHDGACQLFDC